MSLMCLMPHAITDIIYEKPFDHIFSNKNVCSYAAFSMTTNILCAVLCTISIRIFSLNALKLYMNIIIIQCRFPREDILQRSSSSLCSARLNPADLFMLSNRLYHLLSRRLSFRFSLEYGFHYFIMFRDKTKIFCLVLMFFVIYFFQFQLI